MQNGRTALVEVKNSLGDFDSQSSSILPSYVVIFILKIGPKRSFGTVLEDKTIMRIRGNSLY